MPCAITGTEELLQQILIRLTVKKGGFTPDPELGSQLFRLANCPPAQLTSRAERYVREALSGMEGISVTRVEVNRLASRDNLTLAVWVNTADKTLEVTTQL